MFGIGHLFKRIQNAQTQELLLRGEVSKIIQKHVGVPIDPVHLTIKGAVVELKNANSALKSAIFIKKAAILKDIAALPSLRTITEVR